MSSVSHKGPIQYKQNSPQHTDYDLRALCRYLSVYTQHLIPYHYKSTVDLLRPKTRVPGSNWFCVQTRSVFTGMSLGNLAK